MLAERMRTFTEGVISLYGLVHPEELAEHLGLTVVEVQDPLKAVRGAFICKKGLKLVCVDASLPTLHRHAAVLHECGHYLLHPGENRFFIENRAFLLSGRKELEATLFAFFYLVEWNRELLEQLEHNLCRFAKAHGLPTRVAEVAAAALCKPEAVAYL
ncbi:ImmA/IrrE family metallo-endopeptidase [Ammonifex thiophilus]|uniref:ImmA/IrrE family metallo-endopeptidase n=1 Tax=Ammonifex thiophilus TaxID=444093 RepID=A0A3D8P5V6_9THEO|nr:ImmA/IrrE family metallo-endopeptidase [Ammonifex thiophilus]RDV83906.1 ImmA/IrrE family metallo-endopeptidase [Ammonifex thiophilus]